MTCPRCHVELIVMDSRPFREQHYIRRRRKCPLCSYRVTTYEHQFAEKYTLSSARAEMSRVRALLGEALTVMARMEETLGDGQFFSAEQVRTLKLGNDHVTTAQAG